MSKSSEVKLHSDDHMKDLEIREELVGLHSNNPFIRETSSSRGYMSSSHLSQAIPIYHGDEKIVQSGLEKQFANNTFSKKIDKDSRIVKIIPRYRGLSSNTVNAVVEHLVIVENIETEEYDCIRIPYYNQTHVEFGFKYNKNEDLINSLRPGDVIQGGTILADSPTVRENSGWALGANANLALIGLPETAEDGMIISDELAEKMSYDVYETKIISFGSDKFPLNLYGDENNYKPFPEIGELVNPDSVLCALREYDTDLSPALCSKKDVRQYDTIFDHCVYVNGPGQILDVMGEKVTSGQVVDIKVFTSPKYKKDVYAGTSTMLDKYVTSLKIYYQDIIDVYEEISKEHYARYKNNDIKISPRFHRLIIESMAVCGKASNKLSYLFRSDPLDLYMCSITLKFRRILCVGNKCSDSYGSKGVIIKRLDKSKMPFVVDEFGNKTYADIVMDPASLVSRMNVGRIYEHYFNDMARRCKALMVNDLGGITNISKVKDDKVIKAFNTLLGLLQLIDTEQYPSYLEASKDINKVREIVNEAINQEVFILYKITSKKRPYQVVLDTMKTIYYPKLLDAYMETEDGLIHFNDKVRIAPVYELVLNKTADNYLAAASAKLNHYNIPINAGSVGKDRLPWRANAVRIMSETEGRLFLSYGSRKLIAELKDRASSVPTHREIYKNILDADIPTNIDHVIDRNLIPYGEDAALHLINNIYNSDGISIEYDGNDR